MMIGHVDPGTHVRLDSSKHRLHVVTLNALSPNEPRTTPHEKGDDG